MSWDRCNKVYTKRRRQIASKKRWAKYFETHPIGHVTLYALGKKKEAREARSAADLPGMYGITLNAFKAQVRKQGGRCALCGSFKNTSKNKRRLDVDHDHKTGQFRGAVCGKCNLIIGQIEKMGGLVWLKRALSYL